MRCRAGRRFLQADPALNGLSEGGLFYLAPGPYAKILLKSHIPRAPQHNNTTTKCFFPWDLRPGWSVYWFRVPWATYVLQEIARAVVPLRPRTVSLDRAKEYKRRATFANNWMQDETAKYQSHIAFRDVVTPSGNPRSPGNFATKPFFS